MADGEAHSHCQSGHVCSYIIALSNQMPVFNAMHKRTHRLEEIKYIKDLRIIRKTTFVRQSLHLY